MKLIDISRPLHTGMPHWPGDAGTVFQPAARIADGKACNLGHLALSVHNGSHADAPYHYNNAGLTMDAVDLALYVGPCRVIDARGHATFTPALFDGIDLAPTPRVLFRTDTWTDLAVFPATWPLLDPALPAWLAARGVRLVGLDVPSVDALVSDGMPMHHRFDAANVLILESLDLRSVTAGTYELIALPLKLTGADGSPVRAVLRTV